MTSSDQAVVMETPWSDSLFCFLVHPTKSVEGAEMVSGLTFKSEG